MRTVIRLLWRIRKLLMLAAVITPLADAVHDKTALGRLGRGPDSEQELADNPTELSGAAWKRTLKQTKLALQDKDLSTSAAGLAYYATISFFPVLIGLSSFYVLFTSPSSLLSLIDNLKLVLPAAVADLLHDQLAPIAASSNKHLGLAAGLSVLALLWTTSGGLQNLVKATNKAYEVKETRGLVKRRLASILLSIALLVFGVVIIFVLILQGDALRHWGAPDFIATTFPILRWPVLVLLISILLSIIYRYAPDRQKPRWHWVSWGATAATILWLVISALFFFYVQNFANFNKTYGTLAGLIVLMTWFNFSSLIVLLGAQVNKKMEANTNSRTTA
jgi:membrane protein